MTKAIVFDFDGVIADSMPLQEACWRSAVRLIMKADGDEVESKIIRNLYDGFAGTQMFLDVEVTDEQQGLLRRTKDEQWSKINAQTPLMADASMIIRELKNGFVLSIATTAERNYVEAVLNREDLMSSFRFIATNADVSRPKPASDLVDAIVEKGNFHKNEVCVIGDSENDRLMARNADVGFVLFGEQLRVKSESDMIHLTNWKEVRKLFFGGLLNNNNASWL